jgi:hypothetical protein
MDYLEFAQAVYASRADAVMRAFPGLISDRIAKARAAGTLTRYRRWWAKLWDFARAHLTRVDPEALPPQSATEWLLLGCAFHSHLLALPATDPNRPSQDGLTKFGEATRAMISFLAFPDDAREAASPAQLMQMSASSAAARRDPRQSPPPGPIFHIATVFAWMLADRRSLSELSLLELRDRTIVLLTIDTAGRRSTTNAFQRSATATSFGEEVRGEMSMQAHLFGLKGHRDRVANWVAHISGCMFDERICSVRAVREWLRRSAPLAGYAAGTLLVPEPDIMLFCRVSPEDTARDAERGRAEVPPLNLPAAPLSDDRCSKVVTAALQAAADFWRTSARSIGTASAAACDRAANSLNGSKCHDIRRAVASFLDRHGLATTDDIQRLGGWESAATFNDYYRRRVEPPPPTHSSIPTLMITYTSACLLRPDTPMSWRIRRDNFAAVTQDHVSGGD